MRIEPDECADDGADRLAAERRGPVHDDHLAPELRRFERGRSPRKCPAPSTHRSARDRAGLALRAGRRTVRVGISSFDIDRVSWSAAR